MTDDRTGCASRPGRPRSAAADAAILEATLDLFGECGFAGVTMEAVADRAGVAKSTVYRRYPSKLDLVMAAWDHGSPGTDELVETGSIERDLLGAAQRLRTVFATTAVGRAVPAALAAIDRHPEFAESHRAFLAGRRAPMAALVERAVARGELRADTDPELLIDLVTGPILYRSLVRRVPVDDAVLAAIVASAVAGFRAPG